MFSIGGQRAPAALIERLRQRRRGSEPVSGDPGEHHPVVPLSSALLQGLEGGGETAGRAGPLGGVLRDVAGEFGDLPDFVEIVRQIETVLRFGRRILPEPVLRDRDQPGGREREVFRRLQRIQQRFEGPGEAGLSLLQDLEQFLRCLLALLFQIFAELAGVILELTGAFSRSDLFDEIELNVDVADGSGGAAELLQNPGRFAGRFPVSRNSGQNREHGELAFDAAGRGPETVHGSGLRIGEAEGDGCFKRSDVLAESAKRVSCCGRVGHKTWTSDLTTAGKTMERDNRAEACSIAAPVLFDDLSLLSVFLPALVFGNRVQHPESGLMRNRLFLWILGVSLCSAQGMLAQTASHKARGSRAGTGAGAVWTPEVQQYLGVDQGNFTMVGLNRLSKAQLDALVDVAKNNLFGDPRRHVLTCPGIAAGGGKARVLLTVSGDDASGQRSTEIQQALGALNDVTLVDSAAQADRALHVVIQEQTLGKRTIGYTASYVTATPCTDQARKADVELKGQLGTYTDPRGVDLANDLAKMLDEDLRSARSGQ